MTQNSDFNEEKKVSTKVYLDQIHQRLFLEQSLITERIKKYFNKQLIEQIAPIVQQLADLACHCYCLTLNQLDRATIIAHRFQ